MLLIYRVKRGGDSVCVCVCVWVWEYSSTGGLAGRAIALTRNDVSGGPLVCGGLWWFVLVRNDCRLIDRKNKIKQIALTGQAQKKKTDTKLASPLLQPIPLVYQVICQLHE
jgi:hypothetical protein